MDLLSRLFRTTSPPARTEVSRPDPAARPADAASASSAAASATPAAPALDPAAQQKILHDIESGALDTAERVRLAVEGETTRVRQAAADSIHDPALWPELLVRLRGRDKAAYKLIRQRHDARLAEQRALAQAQGDAEALCASIEKHATRVHDAMYEPTLSVLSTRWQALPPEVDAAMRERGQRALDRCREVILAHRRELERLAAERAAEAERSGALEAERQALTAAAERAAAERAASEASARAAEEAARVAAAERAAEQQATEAQRQDDLRSLIRLSGAALQRGDTRRSARFRQSIEDALGPDGRSTLPPHLVRSLEQLDARLNELRQWKDYAAAPKRIELIEEMEALIGVDEPPETLAEHVRALRQEWRTINSGLAVSATSEAERFEQAFQKAFQPCQVYFAEQAALRRANAEARRQILERVRAFEAGLDAEHPDHPLIQRVLREAPREWRERAPVDRDASRALDPEFFGALDRLRAIVTTWHARNLEEKQALIARAQSLASSPDLARAIDEVKQLQAQWKASGPVPHAQSQALWEQFRAQCDGVFARRQQQFAERSAAFEQTRSEADALCARVEQACDEAAPADRASGEARLREWHDAFAALGELPRAHARDLRERFQRATSRYESLLAGIARRDAEAAEADALAAARHVRTYQRAVFRGQPDDECAALEAAATAFIAGVARWPSKSIPQALRQILARSRSAELTGLDDLARERALRRLCVRAEILSGTATPPEDADARRACELELLQQGLGQARRVDERTWDALRLEWLGLGAIEPAIHDELERRFLQSCERGRARAR